MQIEIKSIKKNANKHVKYQYYFILLSFYFYGGYKHFQVSNLKSILLVGVGIFVFIIAPVLYISMYESTFYVKKIYFKKNRFLGVECFKPFPFFKRRKLMFVDYPKLKYIIYENAIFLDLGKYYKYKIMGCDFKKEDFNKIKINLQSMT